MTNMAILKILTSYPRQRPPLSSAHRKLYIEEYKLNRIGGGLLFQMVHKLETWLHRMVAQHSGPHDILELGAGSLNHIPYEPNVSNYDVVEPFADLYRNSPHLPRVRRLFTDIFKVPDKALYHRIISVAVLEHLTDLPSVVARSGLLLDRDGIFQASIPTEGGLLWETSWRLTTGVAYRLRTGLDYKSIIRYEHINDAEEIICIIRHFFEQVRVVRFPLPLVHLSFYTYIEACKPRLDVCDSFRSQRSPGLTVNDPVSP